LNGHLKTQKENRMTTHIGHCLKGV